MARLGLPELYLAGIPPVQVDAAATLVNATAQTLIDRGDLTPR